MNILVPLKPILDPAGMIVNRKAGRVFVNRENYMTNPADKRALEAALRIKDEAGADVIVAAFGPDRSADSLLEARAMGADRAILIDIPSPDETVSVHALAALCHHLGQVDLVIVGDSALDTGASIGPRLAEALDFAFLGGAVQCSVEGNAARIIRRGDSRGRPDRASARPAPAATAHEADLPAVVAVTREGAQPRYPHGGNIITAYRDANAIESLSPADLGLSDSDLQPVAIERGQSFPPEREFGKQASLDDIASVIGHR